MSDIKVVLVNFPKINQEIFSRVAQFLTLRSESEYLKEYFQKENRQINCFEIHQGIDDRRQLINWIDKNENIQHSLNLDIVKQAVEKNETVWFVFNFEKCDKIGDDYINLQYFFLLKQKYPNCLLLINDRYEKEEDYFKISHFLYFESIRECDFVFYKSKINPQVRRLQTNGVGKLKKFLPLLWIDIDIYKLLSLRVSEIENNDRNQRIKFSEQHTSFLFEKIYEYCKGLLQKTVKDCSNYEEEISKCGGLSILALYLFCAFYHHKDNIENWNEDAFRLLALELTDGMLQLVENICLHSECKRGYLSFSYVEQENQNFFRINVIDYSLFDQEKEFHSIVNDHFYKHLNDKDEFKKYFRFAELKDFFVPEEVESEKMEDGKFYVNYWDQYFYNKPENAAFHYGLQVFASIIRGYKGNFYVYSGYQFDNEKNQKFVSNFSDLNNFLDKEIDIVFPGTHYEVLFPITLKPEQKSIGFNSKISNKAFDEILSYQVKDISEQKYKELLESLEVGTHSTQEQKENSIKSIKKYLIELKEQGLFNNNKYHITRINFEKFYSGHMMEFFCKALMLFIKENHENYLKIAIVNCSDECMLEFARWFLIFYDKQNICKEMKNVEIYMVGKKADEDFLLSGESIGISQGRIEKVCVSRGVFNQRQQIISQAIWRKVKESSNFVDDNFEIIPYDVIVEMKQGKKIFEYAVLNTLDTNMQSMNFGCKVENSHVRIGSKIHITSNFYEAHSLFHSNYYTSRFALLLAQKLEQSLEDMAFFKNKKIVLIGYETYSELLICEIKKVLERSYMYSNVEHIIFDTDSNDNFRFWNPEYKEAYFINIVPINSTLSTHNKMISLYNKYGMNKEHILANFAIILIRDVKNNGNNEKRIKDGYIRKKQVKNNLSPQEKDYWEGIDTDNNIVYTKLVDKEIVYLIGIENQWERPLECECCYPISAKKESPLIETNKASVIPSYMVGIKDDKSSTIHKSVIEEYNAKQNDERISAEIINKSVLQYSHLSRNGNDYRFYINSEHLFNQIELFGQDDLEKWCDQVRCTLKGKVSKYELVDLCDSLLNLFKSSQEREYILEKKGELENIVVDIEIKEAISYLMQLENYFNQTGISNKNKCLDAIKYMIKNYENKFKDNAVQSYDIIVSPVHHSNAAWIDQVTEKVFENMPAILHFDVQKEFRDNMKTKYSNLTLLYKNLKAAGKAFEINFHFVDDTIVSGKTYNRAKTLIHSLFPLEAFNEGAENKSKVNLFKSVIVLFNRMSSASKLQYVNTDMYFSYINIFIPNLRNHEDACIMCKLVSDMNSLKRRSALNHTAEYFERREIKYTRMEEMEYERKKEQKQIIIKNHDRSYRRFYCTNRIFEKVGEMGNAKNDCKEIRKIMIQLIDEIIITKRNVDENMEWIISYLKVFSRPLITFRKSFLEAYFHMAISILDMILYKEKNDELKKLSDFLVKFHQKSSKKEELFLVLMKSLLGGLGKVKSNYIIRIKNIIAVFDCITDVKISKSVEMEFKEWYIFNIKRLLELSGDETKSLWLEKILLEGKEWKSEEVNNVFIEQYGIDTDFGKNLYLENTRLIYDAISDLDKNFYVTQTKGNGKLNDTAKKIFEKKDMAIPLDYYYLHNFSKLLSLDKKYYSNHISETEIENYNLDCFERVQAMVQLYRHLNRPDILNNTTIYGNNYQIEEYYSTLLNYMGLASGACRVSLFGADEKESRLKKVKKILKGIYDENNIDDEELKKRLETDESVHTILYRITWFDKSERDRKEDTKELKKKRQDILKAEELLQILRNIDFSDSRYLCIGKSLVIDCNDKKVLFKIHNNWVELLEDCKKKDKTMIQVDPFYFYFDFSNLNEEGDFTILRGMRNILTFRDSLVKKIEEDFNNNLIQLTIESQRKANDMSSNRAAGHTKMDEIKDFFSKNGEFFQTGSFSNVEKNEQYIMGDMLKLLADSYCSHLFRVLYPLAYEPITQDQLDNCRFLNDYWINDFEKELSVFRNSIFSIVDSSTKNTISAEINLNIQAQGKKLFNVDYEECWALLVVLLVQNALKYSSITKDNKRHINIYDEGEYIIVENEIETLENIKEMKNTINRTPEGKNAGISLWVIDQFIRFKKRQYFWNKYITNDNYVNKKRNNVGKEDIENVLNCLIKLEDTVVEIENINNLIKIKLPLLYN